MKLCALIAAALLAMAMPGCAPRGTSKNAVPAVPVPAVAAAPPPEPLSVPQTHVQLPPPQPLNPEALVTPPPPVPPPAAAPIQPAAPAARRNPVASSPPPKPDPTPAAAAEPAPPSIQEVLPEGQRTQLQKDAAESRKRVRAWLDSTAARRLTGQAKLTRDRIQSFLKASDDAERRGDMREAVQLAGRAEILIRELQGGR
jgi:hypothetical protein